MTHSLELPWDAEMERDFSPGGRGYNSVKGSMAMLIKKLASKKNSKL